MYGSKRMAVLMSAALFLVNCFFALSVTGERVAAEETDYGISNPAVASHGIVTWDCIQFGNYWQTDTNGDGKADQKDDKQPVKWRVLSVDGNDAFLLADHSLDCQPYHQKDEDVTWETSSIRAWLNQYFLQEVFSEQEQKAIMTTKVVNVENAFFGTEGGNETEDKLYLLSVEEATNPAYGFNQYVEMNVVARKSVNSAYAKTCGAYTVDSSSDPDKGYWWLRSPGEYQDNASFVSNYGDVGYYGNIVNYKYHTVRPVLHLDLSVPVWEKVEQVTATGASTEWNEEKKPLASAEPNRFDLENPRTDTSEKTTWDCIQFGNYWQEDTNKDGKVNKSDTKQPIKWRVLRVDGDDAFLLSDQNLDCQKYQNDKKSTIVWEKSSLRTWLNETFYHTAFSSEEQKAVKITTVENNQNIFKGSSEGNDTNDFVYLLSLAEIKEPAYGFCQYIKKKSGTREATNTSYTAGYSGMRGKGRADYWWLRSSGCLGDYAVRINSYGWGQSYSVSGVRPVLHLDLSKSVWKKAGAVTADGKKTEDTAANGQAAAVKTPVSTATPKPAAKKAVTKPGKVTVKSVKNQQKKKVTVIWKKVKEAKGYQVQYAWNRSFTRKRKTKTTTKTKIVIKNLKKKTVYYIRVRAYKKNGSKKVCGSWSNIKKIKVKK